MVEYVEELEEFFEIGKEIVCYTDPEDLAEKIKYYLKDGPINPDTNSPTLEFSKIYTFKLNPFMR